MGGGRGGERWEGKGGRGFLIACWFSARAMVCV